MKVLGQLEVAQLEQIASTGPALAPTGRIYADVTDPTAALPMFHNGTAWKRFAYYGDPTTSYNVTAAKTSNYTAVIDDFIRCDCTGGAFTVTLPTAVGQGGRKIVIVKTDSTTNALNIATTSSQTMNGVTTNNLSTAYEEVELVSDGANWILKRYIPEAWVSFTPTGSWSSNTTYTGRYRRVGDSCFVVIALSLAGAPTAASLTFNLPFTVDTAKTYNSSTGFMPARGIGNDFDAAKGYLVYGKFSSTTVLSIFDSADDTYIRLSSAVNATTPFTWAASDELSVEFSFPVVGWKS